MEALLYVLYAGAIVVMGFIVGRQLARRRSEFANTPRHSWGNPSQPRTNIVYESGDGRLQVAHLPAIEPDALTVCISKPGYAPMLYAMNVTECIAVATALQHGARMLAESSGK